MNTPYRASDAGPEPTNGPIVLDPCQNCGEPSDSLVLLEGWDYRACPKCAAEAAAMDAMEPECECIQTDADLFSAAWCELHNDRSRWNMRQRSLEIEREVA